MRHIKQTFIGILASCLISTSVWSQTQIDSSKIVKVLSFNILHGKTMKGDFNLDVIAKVIIDANPDFVALQEVDYKTNRAKKYDLVTELGWRTKMTPLYGRAMYYDGGEYGEGVLSKTTFLNTRNVPLPYISGDEPRAALEITTVLHSKDTISFIGTHLDHLKLDTNKIMQAKEINNVFSKNKYPTILAGDLNAEPNSNTMAILENFWTVSYDKTYPEPTFSSKNPTQKIDYVLFHPKHKWKVLETRVICDTIASDHCAYLVTLQLLD
ncbi:MAG: endonuclease/exonuclease/phosphatase family protein [Flavobacteriaceae bacterium]|nr:endonuclease/exonuclease/phosphatase family protein [Flavobacteriaceae bacterium]